MSSTISPLDASAGALDASPVTKSLNDLAIEKSKCTTCDSVESGNNKSKPSSSDRITKLASGKPLERSDLPVFHVERQPYWKDPKVNVVMETHAVLNPHGGWVVKKNKYLKYTDGRREGF